MDVEMRWLRTAPLQADPNQVYVSYEDLQNWLRKQRDGVSKIQNSLTDRDKLMIQTTVQTLMDGLADNRYKTRL